jgi:hypothetical protein
MEGERPLSPYFAFEPVVTSVPENMTVDWRPYDPPQELLVYPVDTSEEL